MTLYVLTNKIPTRFTKHRQYLLLTTALQPGRDADHSPPPSANVKKERAIVLLPPSAFHGM
jgi:hypothetical protein